MTVLSLYLNTTSILDPNTVISDKTVTANNLKQIFKSLAAGALPSSSTLVAQVAPAFATGTWTTASGSGTQTLVINGVSISITWATSDTHSAALMAAAVNASVSGLVAGFVTATSALGVVTLNAVKPGLASNAITTTATGTGASAEQARLTGGTAGTQSTFNF